MAGKKTKKMAKKRVKKRAKRPAVKKRVIKITTKKAKKRLVKKKTPRKALIKRPKENIIGIVTHYFPKVRAAAIRLKAPLSIGESVKFKGHTTDFTQMINSLQIDRQPISQGKKGQEIGLLVSSRVRHNDLVYRV